MMPIQGSLTTAVTCALRPQVARSHWTLASMPSLVSYRAYRASSLEGRTIAILRQAQTVASLRHRDDSDNSTCSWGATNTQGKCISEYSERHLGSTLESKGRVKTIAKPNTSKGFVWKPKFRV